MTDQLTNALTISCIAILGVLLWALSIAFVLRDVNRRSLPGTEQAAWLALTALIPLVGGIAYLFARLLDRFFRPGAPKNAGFKKRITAYKDSGRPAKRLPTVAAVDTFRETVADLNMNVLAGTEKTGRGSAYLESSAGPVAGLRFTIQTLPLRIGRGPQVALSLEADQGVSRQHAEIYESAGRLRIRDLQSTHGTFVNGRRITDESLSSGDQISLGLSTLVFTMEDRDAST